MPSRPHALDSLSHLVTDTLNPIHQLRVMGRLVRRTKKKPGTAPGTVIHTGLRRVEEVRIQTMRFDADELVEEVWTEIPKDMNIPTRGEGVLWVNVDGLHDVALLEHLGRSLGLHPLVLEDVASVGQRPKFEEYEDHLFVVLHMLGIDETPLRILDEQVSVIVGPGYLVSFQESSGDVFGSVRERLRASRGRIRARGSDYLAYALIDALADSYFQIVERIGEQTEEIESEVIERPSHRTMQEIHDLKHELLVLRRSVWPLREMMSSFLRVESPFVEESTKVYLRDVLDHIYQLIDGVEILRDIASGMRDLYLSNVSNRTNEVMRVLTVMASIFIPLTFVAGVYGMNFEYMPELEMRWAYPTVLLVMLAASGGMLWGFRRKGWI